MSRSLPMLPRGVETASGEGCYKTPSPACQLREEETLNKISTQALNDRRLSIKQISEILRLPKSSTRILARRQGWRGLLSHYKVPLSEVEAIVRKACAACDVPFRPLAPDALIDVREAARLLDCSERSVRLHAGETGVLKAFKLMRGWRFYRVDVLAHLRLHGTSPELFLEK